MLGVLFIQRDAMTAKQLKQTFGELLCGQNQQLQKCVSALK